jgi:hypothetical protein
MDVTVHIPDDIATRLAPPAVICRVWLSKGSRLRNIKNGHITKAALRRLLCFATRYRLAVFSRLTTYLRITPGQTLSRNVKTCAAWASDAQCGSSLATTANQLSGADRTCQRAPNSVSKSRYARRRCACGRTRRAEVPLLMDDREGALTAQKNAWPLPE